MPYPSNVATVTLTGTYVAADGSGPASGIVSFTPNATLADGTSTPPDIVVPKATTVVLNASGSFSTVLMATDDPHLSPTGWAYTVVETIIGEPQRTYLIQLPAAQTPVDLSTVAPLTNPPAQVQYILASARGAVNGVASLDGAGNVPLSQLGNVSGGGTPSGTVVAETSYGQASSAGTANAYSRGDHTHGSPSLTSTAPTTSAVGDGAAVGTATTPARADHLHGREAFGAVTAQTSYGLSSGNGTATTDARSDHTHGTPALTSSAPTTSAVGDAAAVGTGTTPARSDHVHGRETFGAVTAQTAYGAASANGTATTVSRSDHTHGTPPLPYAVLAFSQAGTVTATAGTARLYNDSGRTLTIQAVRASVGTAPTGSSLIVDILKDGTTIFTTAGNRPTIAASANTSGKVTNMDVTTIADGSYFTVTVAQVGSTVPGSDLTVQVWAA